MSSDSLAGRRHVRAKRFLGQNFLVDPNLQRKIVDTLSCSTTDTVLEIGPGHGALTRHLVGRVGHLVLVELDDQLVEELAREWGTHPDVELHHRDFLKLDVASVAGDLSKLTVVGNIPYSITAPIIFKLLERPRPREILLMVQREVGDRLLADPGTSEYGAMTVGVQSVAKVKRMLSVPRRAFRPIPRVDSSVVRIRPIFPPPISELEERSLRALTRAAFQWRRKQLQKILRDHGDLRFDPFLMDGIAEEMGWDLTRRPETFSPEDFIRLARFVSSQE